MTPAFLGPPGPPGPPGNTGATGSTGATGAAGATWTSGSGVPSNSNGSNGDFYLRTTNGDVYLKTAGSWAVATNIKGADGAAGAAGPAGPAPTYASLIAASPGGVPIVGYACQDASMASAIAATYGGCDLDTLTGVSRSTSNPLYPGAVSALVASAAGNKAKSSAVPAGLVGVHYGWSMEAWVYVPAGASKKGMAFALAKDTSTYEGFGLGVGGSNYTDTDSTENYAVWWKAGVANYGGVSGVGCNTDFGSAASGAFHCRLSNKGRWHHLAHVLHHTNDANAWLYVDGEPFGSTVVWTDGSHGAFTTAARASLFNDPGAAGTPSAIQVCHAYAYDYPLSHGDIRARVALVHLLNAIG